MIHIRVRVNMRRLRPWLVLTASFFLLFTTIGLGSNGLSLLYVPVAEALNFSQTKFNLYYTVATIAGLVAAPIAGKIFSKNFSKARLYIIIGGAVNLACFVAYSFCRTLPEFYIVSFFRGAGTSLISATPATMLINEWFVDKRNTATSIAFMGSSAGGLVYTQISKWLLNRCGWEKAYLGLGIISFVTIILVAILIVPTPEAKNEKPYGYDKINKAGSEKAQSVWLGITAGQAMKTPVFWIMCVAMFLGAIVVMGVQQCVASSLQADFGYSQDLAAGVVSIFMIFICIGKLVIGWVFDKAGVKTGLVYSCVLLVVSMICMVLADNLIMAYAFAVAFGLGNMTSTVISTTMTSTTFGTKEYGTIYGTVTMFMTGGMSIGPVISAAIFDASGSYRNAWILYAVVSVVTTVLLLAVTRMGKKLQEKYKEGNSVEALTTI